MASEMASEMANRMASAAGNDADVRNQPVEMAPVALPVAPDAGALAARLSHERAGVRRIAARDLLSINPFPDSLCDLVVSRIIVETDDAARHLLVRLAGVRLMERARPHLVSLIADAGTPVLVAHEARVSLDRLDLAQRRTPGDSSHPPSPVLCAPDRATRRGV